MNCFKRIGAISGYYLNTKSAFHHISDVAVPKAATLAAEQGTSTKVHRGVMR